MELNKQTALQVSLDVLKRLQQLKIDNADDEKRRATMTMHQIQRYKFKVKKQMIK